MNDKNANQAIRQIESMFDRRYSEDARQKLVRSLEPEPDKAMIEAIKKLEQEFNTLPTPIVLLRVVREQATFIRESDARREAREHKDAQAKLRPDRQSTKIGVETCTLVRGLMAGVITRRQYLEGLRALEDRYPGTGFATVGSRMTDFYQRKGLSLDSCPME